MGQAEQIIFKARNDKREYRRVVLPNELQVLLISDPETDKAAAAMDVYVGHFSDPEGLEGLAHFLEHMLFYASSKYPVENSYMKFLTEHGGHSNAFTSSEHTNFHFDVNADYLEEALDRFAQFFICPLMSADATSREINAVDSENKKNLTMDSRRFNQLSKHICYKGHPYSKFGTGNLDTLEIRPKERGIDTREELLKFYDKHYSSNLMCLVIYGKETLEKLQNLAEANFSAIKNKERCPPHFPGQPCLPEHLQVLVKAVPVREIHSLVLSWLITPEIQHYKEGPSRYLGHLLGHEADGSLFALLKNLGLATSLGAGEMEGSLEYAFFAISVELTDQGQSRVEEVLGLIFQYMKILQHEGVAEWLFEEVRAVREIQFHFQDKGQPIHYATNLASSMQLYTPEDWLVGSSLPRNFNANTIMKVLKQLSPENVRVLWASKQFEGKTMNIEPWYGTSFSIEKIADGLLKEWITTPPDTRLHLPTPNPFIPSDFELRNSDTKVQYPYIVSCSTMSKLWYKPDSTFYTPKACIMIHFNSPESNCSPEADVLTGIFLQLLEDYLNEYAYFAEVAGLHYNIWQSGNGFQVSVSGYNHKLTILLEKIMEKIVGFEVKEDRFKVIKEKVLKDCLNFRFQQPYQQALYYCSLLLEHRKWHMNEYLEVLPLLEASDLMKFFPRILSRLFIECYVAGNLTSEEAKSLIQQIEKAFSYGPHVKTKPVFDSQHMEQRIVRLEPGANFYYPVCGLNLEDENSALQMYLQVGQDETITNVLLELLILSSKQEVFHQLRSVEQLGYIVALANRNDYGVRGAQFIIQSTVKDPRELDLRVEAFLNMFDRRLQEFSDEDFKRNVDALIEVKLEKHKNLREESRFYWREIYNGTLKFDRPQIEVTALRKLQKEDLLRFFDDKIKVTGTSRTKISVQIYASSHENEYKLVLEGGNATIDESKDGLLNGTLKEAELDSVIDAANIKDTEPQLVRIDNIYNFKRSQSLFGSIKGGLDSAYNA